VSQLSDLLTRKVDVLAFRGVFPGAGEQLLAQELVGAGDGGMLVAGIEKLAQKVLLALLLVNGTKTYAPDDGCQFMADARRGLWRTVADVSQSFYLARVDVRRQVVAGETDDDPADERYGGLTLDGVTLAGDTVTVAMTLVSVAGSTYKFLTPVKVPIR
jgi:hypothetical protein